MADPTDPKIQDPSRTIENAKEGAASGESMTRRQREYLKRLSREAGEEFSDDLTKDQASKRIEDLKGTTGQAGLRGGSPVRRGRR
jgi:hypothetical protein